MKNAPAPTTAPTVEMRVGPAVVKDWLDRDVAAATTKENTKARRAKRPEVPNPFALFVESGKARLTKEDLVAISEDCRALQKADGPRKGPEFRSLRQCYERTAIKSEQLAKDFKKLAAAVAEELDEDEFKLADLPDGEKITGAAKVPSEPSTKAKAKGKGKAKDVAPVAAPTKWTKDKDAVDTTYLADVDGWSIVQKHSTAWILSGPGVEPSEHKSLTLAKTAAAGAPSTEGLADLLP